MARPSRPASDARTFAAWRLWGLGWILDHPTPRRTGHGHLPSSRCPDGLRLRLHGHLRYLAKERSLESLRSFATAGSGHPDRSTRTTAFGTRACSGSCASSSITHRARAGAWNACSESRSSSARPGDPFDAATKSGADIYSSASDRQESSRSSAGSTCTAFESRQHDGAGCGRSGSGWSGCRADLRGLQEVDARYCLIAALHFSQWQYR